MSNYNNFTLDAQSEEAIALLPTDVRRSLKSHIKLFDKFISEALETSDQDIEKKNRSYMVHAKMQEIISTAASYFEVNPDDLMGDNRGHSHARRREMLSAWLYFYGGLRYGEIHKVFGWGDHTTFYNYIGKFQRLALHHPWYAEQAAGLFEALCRRMQVDSPVVPIPFSLV